MNRLLYSQHRNREMHRWTNKNKIADTSGLFIQNNKTRFLIIHPVHRPPQGDYSLTEHSVWLQKFFKCEHQHNTLNLTRQPAEWELIVPAPLVPCRRTPETRPPGMHPNARDEFPNYCSDESRRQGTSRKEPWSQKVPGGLNLETTIKQLSNNYQTTIKQLSNNYQTIREYQRFCDFFV